MLDFEPGSHKPEKSEGDKMSTCTKKIPKAEARIFCHCCFSSVSVCFLRNKSVRSRCVCVCPEKRTYQELPFVKLGAAAPELSLTWRPDPGNTPCPWDGLPAAACS